MVIYALHDLILVGYIVRDIFLDVKFFFWRLLWVDRKCDLHFQMLWKFLFSLPEILGNIGKYCGGLTLISLSNNCGRSTLAPYWLRIERVSFLSFGN